MKSPLLSLPGAVPAEGRDEGVAAHYGDLFREQRALADGNGFVDLSHRGGGGGGGPGQGPGGSEPAGPHPSQHQARAAP
ncbi:hypothetical protein ACFXAR_30860, partial [Streptomyces rubiginosohelvolus]